MAAPPLWSGHVIFGHPPVRDCRVGGVPPTNGALHDVREGTVTAPSQRKAGAF